MPRQRLTQEQIAQSQSRILQAAARLIARNGYGALSMRALAQEVNLTAGALYRYFPSKQNVLISYWSDAIGKFGDLFANIARTHDDPVDAIKAMLMAYGRFGLEDHDRFRTLFLENDNGASGELDLRVETLRPYQILHQQVQRCLDGGRGSAIPADTATNILWGCIHGMVTLVITFIELDFGNPETLFDAGVSAAIEGLHLHGKDLE